SILGPVVSNFFALRNASQERKMAERCERRERLSQMLNDLIEARFKIQYEGEDARHNFARAYGIAISIPDDQMQELAPLIMDERGHKTAAVNASIKRLGEILAQES